MNSLLSCLIALSYSLDKTQHFLVTVQVVQSGSDAESLNFEDPNTRNLVAEVSLNVSYVLFTQKLGMKWAVFCIFSLECSIILLMFSCFRNQLFTMHLEISRLLLLIVD